MRENYKNNESERKCSLCAKFMFICVNGRRVELVSVYLIRKESGLFGGKTPQSGELVNKSFGKFTTNYFSQRMKN